MNNKSIYKTKLDIGNLPKGSLVKLLVITPSPDGLYQHPAYSLKSIDKIKGTHIGYFFEAETKEELYEDFKKVCYVQEVE